MNGPSENNSNEDEINMNLLEICEETMAAGAGLEPTV